MNKLLPNPAFFLILPVFLAFFSSCTVRTLYLSMADHLSVSPEPACAWEKSKAEPKAKHSIDSLIRATRQLQSFLLIKDGTIQHEWYISGFSENTAHNIKSATKSIVSLLTGIAIDRGYLTEDTDLKSLFGDKMKLDSLTGTVTIRNLLTMQGGFPYTESRYYWLVCSSLDPVKSTLKQRRPVEPGDSAEYSNISANLLGYAVAKAAKMKLKKFADTFLFSPLGIHSPTWANDLRGNNACAGDVFMRPRDLAKIGYLMLNKGMVDGRRIISERWVDESISPKTVFPSFPGNLEYGYLWWIDGRNIPGAFCAIGFGGQILYVSPLDNTIIVTSSTFTAAGWPIVLEVVRKLMARTGGRRDASVD